MPDPKILEYVVPELVCNWPTTIPLWPELNLKYSLPHIFAPPVAVNT